MGLELIRKMPREQETIVKFLFARGQEGNMQWQRSKGSTLR